MTPLESQTTKFGAFGLTDVGLRREHNEDCYAVDSERRVFLVADGMGGHQHGEVASRLAVDAILENLEPDAERVEESLAEALSRAIQEAHRRVWQATVENENLAGMGTTVVGLLLGDRVVKVAHVGDSRAYRLRGGQLERMTRDHSWVGEQVAAGLLSSEQARLHPLRNVVTRALGGPDRLTVDIAEWDVRQDDLFLLCSDGLTGMLEDSEIGRCLSAGEDLEATGKELVRLANERGGLDNITVVLVSVAG